MDSSGSEESIPALYFPDSKFIFRLTNLLFFIRKVSLLFRSPSYSRKQEASTQQFLQETAELR